MSDLDNQIKWQLEALAKPYRTDYTDGCCAFGCCIWIIVAIATAFYFI